jgi:hypothetical protein
VDNTMCRTTKDVAKNPTSSESVHSLPLKRQAL